MSKNKKPNFALAVAIRNVHGYSKGGSVRSPKKGVTLDRLQKLKDSDWYNADTKYEMSKEEGENYLHQLLNNRSEKELKKYIKQQKSTDKKEPEIPFLSKGGKIQKKEIFGERGDPSKKELREKQIAALSKLAEKRYGMPIVPSKGKLDMETGERREGSKAKSPKPDWRSGELESEQTSQAAVHELAHLDQIPKEMRLEDAQTWMDEGSRKAGKLYGGSAKQIQEEIQPMALENPLRRRAGIPAFARPQDKSPIRGESSKIPLRWDHPPRKSADTGEEYTERLPNKKGNPVDLIALAKNLSPANRDRLRDIDEGVLKFKKGKGWVDSVSGDALINLRAQGKKEEAQKRLKERGDNRFSKGGVVNNIRKKMRGK